MIHIEAGAHYLAALQKLGLDPECQFWAKDAIVGHPVLVLVTHQFDRAGPLALSRVLFKAYNAAATPREINPFILRLHSPEQEVIRELGKIVAMDIRFEFKPADQSPPYDPFAPWEINGGGLSFQRDWIYKWKIPAKSRSIVDLSRQWKRFAANVDKLAA